MSEKKYITVNGVMKKNPKYVDPSNKGSTPSTALAIVSSPEEVMTASAIQSERTGIAVPMAESASSTVDMLQEPDMLAQYKSQSPIDGGDILEELGRRFAQYEVPFGMINKLMMLTQYKLDFLVDDSGSMASPTDFDATDASEPVKTLVRNRLRREPQRGEKLSRLEEAEDRLHVMMSILAYIPIEHIQIRFLNASADSVLDRTGKTPEEFEHYAHEEIRRRFSTLRLGTTPVQEPLRIGFEYPGRWSHYLFNDGVPDEGGAAIAQQIIRRRTPEEHVLTLISCTNRDEDTEWMKQVDGQAQYVAEVDDYQDEKDEVMRKQGAAFPFSRGLWLLAQLVASINPFDLDALDENLPLTKFTLDNILGRQLNPKEYQYYFERNPNAALYVREYPRFLNEQVFAYQIINPTEQARRERSAGYVDGERPQRPIPDISAQLAETTAAAYAKFATAYRAQPDAQAMAQMSAAEAARIYAIAPHAAFMAPPPAYRPSSASPSYPPAPAPAP